MNDFEVVEMALAHAADTYQPLTNQPVLIWTNAEAALARIKVTLEAVQDRETKAWQEAQAHIQELEHVIATYDIRNKELEKLLSNEDERVGVLKATIQELEAACDSAQAEVDDVHESWAAARKRIEELEAQLKLVRAARVQDKALIRELEAESARLQGRIARLLDDAEAG